MKNIVFLFILSILFSCSQKQVKTELSSGNWLFQLKIDEGKPALTIPFNVDVLKKKGKLTAVNLMKVMLKE